MNRRLTDRNWRSENATATPTPASATRSPNLRVRVEVRRGVPQSYRLRRSSSGGLRSERTHRPSGRRCCHSRDRMWTSWRASKANPSRLCADYVWPVHIERNDNSQLRTTIIIQNTVEKIIKKVSIIQLLNKKFKDLCIWQYCFGKRFS